MLPPLLKLSESEEDTRNFLLNLPIFDSFNTDELSMLAKHMSYVHLKRGDYLFIEGDQGNFMGFVVNGVLEVIKRADGGQNIVIARLTKGNSIGEMALIDKSPRSATVIARQATTMVTLTDKGFDLLTERSPLLGIKVIQKIARLLSLYMRRTSSRLADLMQPGSNS
jgi:CRP-like cAMP-binding protein